MQESGLQVLQRLREALEKRGAKTIRSLGRVFRQLDSYDGNRKVSGEEFFVGLKECGLDIKQQDASTLLQLLDTNGDGWLDFEEFLIGVRGKPNNRR
jgi:Ca2+-binding EF-hand superfamily protein